MKYTSGPPRMLITSASGMLAANTAIHVARGDRPSRPARASRTPVNECVRLSMLVLASKLLGNQQSKRIGYHLQPGGKAAGMLAVDLHINPGIRSAVDL